VFLSRRFVLPATHRGLSVKVERQVTYRFGRFVPFLESSMSSPKERSEARKKALLSRGSDRLKKLTNSARGEDAPQFLHDDPPLVAPLKSFIGESTPDPHLSSIRTFAPAPAPAPVPTTAQIPDWSPEELRRAMESLGAPGPTDPPSLQDPMPILPAAWGQASAQRTPALTLRQRLSPLFSLLVPLSILFYFVVFREPGLYNSYTRIEETHWSIRWTYLSDLGGFQRSRHSEAVHSAVRC
jgi:hypothetical protein